MVSKIVTCDSEFQTALGTVNPGDCIYIRGGIYRQGCNAQRGGTLGNPVRILPYGDEKPLFDLGANPNTPLQFLLNAPHIVVDGSKQITFLGGSCVRSLETGKYCEYRNLIIRGMKDSGMSLLGEGSVVEGCDIRFSGRSDNKGHSLYIAAPKCVVRNNYLGQAVQGCALHVYHSTAPFSSDCVIENNVIEQCGGIVAAVILQGDRNFFRRNKVLALGSTNPAIHLFPKSQDLVIEDNEIEGTPTAFYEQYATTTNPVSVTLRRNKVKGRFVTPNVVWQNDIQTDNILS